MLVRLLVVVPLLALAACGPSLIPGTQIQDTRDDRDILQVIHQYKDAFESRDADAIANLASPRYLDPRDSVSKDTLRTELKRDFAKVKDIHLDLNVRRIEVDGNHAVVDYFYSEAFLIDTPGAEWQRESDDKQMTLERNPDKNSPQTWLVLSGF